MHTWLSVQVPPREQAEEVWGILVVPSGPLLRAAAGPASALLPPLLHTVTTPVTCTDYPFHIYMPWQLLRWQTLIHTVPVHVTCSAKPLLHTWMTPVTCKDYCCDIQLHFCYIRSAPAMLGLCWTTAIRYTQWTLLYTCQWHWQTLAKQSITTHFSKGSGGANIQVCIIIILFTTITIRDAPSCQVLKSAFYRLVSGTEPSHCFLISSPKRKHCTIAHNKCMEPKEMDASNATETKTSARNLVYPPSLSCDHVPNSI